MKLIVVDLLRKFIAEQAELGGPLRLCGNVLCSHFLKDKQARETISNAWLSHRINSIDADAPTHTAEEVFAHLRELSEQRLRVLMREETRGIISDEQATAIILTSTA